MTPLFILEFVAAIALMIMAHEAGHFIACRLMRIEVEEFGLGLPPRLLKLFRIGSTLYTLNWIPLGGFVKPKGENDPAVPGGLAAAHPLKRIFVSLGGPLTNLLLAVLFYAVMIGMSGEPDPDRLDQVQIQGVTAGSPADLAGLQTGDLLLEVGGETVESVDEARSLIRAHLDEETALTIERDGRELTLSATPSGERSLQQGALGVLLGVPTRPVSAWRALEMGFKATWEHSRLLVQALSQLISGKLDQQAVDLVGPVGMGEIYVEIRQESPQSGPLAAVDALGFFTSITISLGLLNLVPIPALDGGRILLALPQLLSGRRIPKKIEDFLTAGSYTLLLLLLLYVSLRDIVNLFGD